jgi:hypothetical protein
MTDVVVQNAAQINVTTALVDNRLVLSVSGQAIGTVTDEFHPSPAPPANMTLMVQNLVTGAAVSAQWRPTGGTTWFPFTQTTGGVHTSFRVPDVGGESSYDFAAEVTEHGLHCDDPKLVLKTKTSTEDR